MAIKIKDISELAFGGAVTFTEWWDAKRVKEGKLLNKAFYKKAGFYTYLLVGGGSTLAQAFGWLRKYDEYTERMARGFIYDLPRFFLNTVKSLKTTAASGYESDAVREAQRILQQRQNVAALNAGIPANRTYQPEFESAQSHAF